MHCTTVLLKMGNSWREQCSLTRMTDAHKQAAGHFGTNLQKQKKRTRACNRKVFTLSSSRQFPDIVVLFLASVQLFSAFFNPLSEELQYTS